MKKKGSAPTPFWEGSPLVREQEIFSEMAEKKGSSLFLGRYSLNEVVAVLGRKNFLKEARKKDLWPLDFALDSTEYPLQRLQIFFLNKTPDNLIVDLKIREGEFAPKMTLEGLPPFPPQKCLFFEWLTLQNPRVGFSENHAPLPGQTHPGLNLGRKVMDIFLYLGRLTRKDGLVAFPCYFHNALLFSRYFRFLNPIKEGELFSIRHTFSHVPLKQLAWAVHLNCLQRGDGAPYEWTAEEQVRPLNRILKDYFDSRVYKDTAKAAEKRSRLSIDWSTFERRCEEVPALCGPGRNLL